MSGLEACGQGSPIGEAGVVCEFVPDLLAVGVHQEGAATAGNELDSSFGVGLQDAGFQTGGVGQIVSSRAVFDRDLHGPIVPDPRCPQWGPYELSDRWTVAGRMVEAPLAWLPVFLLPRKLSRRVWNR